MAQTVCVRPDAADVTQLAAIAEDQSHPPKHIQRAHSVLLSDEYLDV
ncbi:hypothetical protein FOHLNKBM_4363 [Methylobacterium longum]|nr:hypothetical protein FOHLNKBM_4363 [Methylobacterium longum]